MNEEINQLRSCSFCNKDELNVKYLFYSKKNNIDICNNCILTLSNMIEEKGENDKVFVSYTPSELAFAVSSKVYGQEEAIKEISVCIFKHMYKLSTNESNIINNMLLIGESGNGKTYAMKYVAKSLGVPFIEVDCACLTATGYVGGDISSVFTSACKKYSIEEIKRSIVFLDEFDKIAKSSERQTVRDIGGEAVQQELLKAVEGDIIEIAENKRLSLGKTISLSTHKMLFIAAGAFNGILKEFERIKLNDSNVFVQTKDFDPKNIANKDYFYIRDAIVNFGIIPELLGRMGIIVLFRTLNREDFIKILLGPDSKVKQYIDMLAIYKIDVEVTSQVIELIAYYTEKLRLGARGMDYLIHLLFKDITFSIKNDKSTQKFVIDNDYAESIIQKPLTSILSSNVN